jgi:hypothetical protein
MFCPIMLKKKLWAMLIATLLSQNNDIGPPTVIPSSYIRFLSHKSSHTLCVITQYSTSTLDQSTSRYCAFISGNLVLWMSKKQIISLLSPWTIFFLVPYHSYIFWLVLNFHLLLPSPFDLLLLIMVQDLTNKQGILRTYPHFHQPSFEVWVNNIWLLLIKSYIHVDKYFSTWRVITFIPSLNN